MNCEWRFEPRSVHRGRSRNPEKFDPSKWDRKEVELIQILIQAPELLDFSIENVPPSLFADGPLKQIYEHMEESFHVGGDVSYEHLMLDMENIQLKSIVDRLHDEAISKQKMLMLGERRDFDLPQQFDAVVQSFHELVNDAGYRSTISQLQQRQLDENDEASALENLLKQTRQRQGLTPPMDGQQPG